MADLSPKRNYDGNPPQMDGFELGGTLCITPSEKRKLRTNFRIEANLARSVFRESLVQEWHHEYPAMGDKENAEKDRPSVSGETYDDDDYAYAYFVSVRMGEYNQWAAERKATFLASLRVRPTPDSDHSSLLIRSRHDRIQAFWDGLRRVYFGESEAEPALEDGHLPGTHASFHNDDPSLR